MTELRYAWLEPGPEQVEPGIFRIPLPLRSDGLRAVNVYACVDGDQVVLIDSGWALVESRAELERALKAVGFALGDIGRFLVTHVHADHYTQAVAVRRELGTKVAVGIAERDNLEDLMDERRPTGRTQLDQLLRHGAADLIEPLIASGFGVTSDTGLWEEPDEWIEDRDRLEIPGSELEAIHTPGHTRGHLVFDDRTRGVMFTGDHLLPHITPSIGFESRPGSSPLADFLNSLALVLRLPDRRMLPAHGPAGGSTHRRAQELLDHHDSRLTVCHDTIGVRGSTAFDVASRLGWTRRERPLAQLDVQNRMLAICETAAHLHVLVGQGRLRLTEVDGVERYIRAEEQPFDRKDR
ncbi:MBL fold metallo-hydrolase [Nocardia vaccinii]|uniref:MBL fold metallo-hydrolase n=1 Tax=Nocardia vaccinii TaxID=1822 RepID=UPI001C3F5849|nr:MBL fold metallo-hydrolase [Nocardia vaccinii]